MFGNWLNGIDKATKTCIRVGVCALVWAIWNCRNDMVFNKGINAHLLQVIHMAGYFLDPLLGIPITNGREATYGFRMHTAPDGRTGCLQPGWLTAF